MNCDKVEMLVSILTNAEKEMGHNHSKERIKIVKACIDAGFAEDILNSPMIKNAINLLAPFIRNSKVKQAIQMLQEGLSEEYKKESGKPWKKNW